MYRTAALFALLATLGVSTPSRAGGLTGNKLHEICQDDDLKLACSFYILGVVDGISTQHDVERFLYNRVRPPCTPEGMTGGQAHDVVINYLAAHPEKRHEPADLIALQALVAAFPCPKVERPAG